MKACGIRLTLAAALLAGGCVTTGEKECRAADWRQVGFEDGARGRAPGYVARHRDTCAQYGVSPDLERYRVGRESGLQRYCTAGNGFELGRGGGDYGGLCPADLEGRFVTAWQTGRRLHRLQTSIEQMRRDEELKRSELARLEARSQNVATLLRAGGLSVRNRELLTREYGLLQSNITRLRTDARVLELEAAKLQREYDLLDASHAYR